MSDFETLFAETGLAAIADLHGDTGRVTVTPLGGVAASVATILIGDETVEQSQEGTGQTIGYKRALTFATAALASLKMNAKVTVDGVLYSVRSVSAGGVNTITAELYRAAGAEMTRPDYRANRGV